MLALMEGAHGMEKLYLVVDLGGTHIRTAVANAGANLRGRRDEPTPIGGPDTVMARIADMADRSARAAGTSVRDLSAAVVASPGPLDRLHGIIFSPPNMQGWETVPLKDELERRLGIPVTVENDANAAALGEFHFGAARGTRNAVYMTISTGIGGGVVADGRLLVGTSGIAGEIGHMTIDRHGPVCGCGNVGCLEASGSGTAIARRFKEAVETGRKTSLVGETPTAAEIADAAQAGDPLAREIFLDAADAIGTGVANAINLFNPDVVVLGGGVSKIGTLLFDAVEDVAGRRALPSARGSARIVAAELGEDVGLIGALAVALTQDTGCQDSSGEG